MITLDFKQLEKAKIQKQPLKINPYKNLKNNINKSNQK